MRIYCSLEEDWKLIVTDWEMLPERQRQQQSAIWELVYTEVTHLRTLKVVTDVSSSLILRHCIEAVELKTLYKPSRSSSIALKLR